MNRTLKRILLGLIIWAVPFVTSLFIWDVEAGAPIFSMAWFYAFMAFTGALGFAIAAYLYFKGVKNKDAVTEGWTAGITWYVELILLDLAVLVGIFGMTMGDYYHLLLTYLNPLVLAVILGYILKK